MELAATLMRRWIASLVRRLGDIVARHALAVLLACLPAPLVAAETPTVRLGILQYGTVGWEVDVMQRRGFAAAEGVDLHVVPLASPQALAVALQGGAVDVIVSDWIWVSRQRAAGHRYTFVPYSLMVGSLLVRPDAGVSTFADLRARKVGVAGGPVDKSWLLLRAWSRARGGEDLATLVEPTFAAPPLLNELVVRGDLDAVLNYWHYAARLKAVGLSELVSVRAVLVELGITPATPLLGWVFDEDWARDNPEAISAFLRADYTAKHLMLESDQEWQALRPMLKTDDETTAVYLRDAWRDGVPRRFGPEERDSARRLFELLATEGGAELVGDDRVLARGTFWDGFNIPSWPR